MATATKKSRAVARRADRPARVRVTAPMEFVIFEDNGGCYHWRILAGDGATLGQSGDFASYGEAERAAREIRNGAVEAVAR